MGTNQQLQSAIDLTVAEMYDSHVICGDAVVLVEVLGQDAQIGLLALTDLADTQARMMQAILSHMDGTDPLRPIGDGGGIDDE